MDSSSSICHSVALSGTLAPRNEEKTISSGFIREENVATPEEEIKPPGLAQRMLVRAGFNAPKLNTERFRSGKIGSFSSEAESPFLTIPPGLSPTSFLESPVFISNPMVQPSPTTGKLELTQSLHHSSMSLPSSSSDSFIFKARGDLPTNQMNFNHNHSSQSSRPPASPIPESPENLSDSLLGDEMPDQSLDGDVDNRGESSLIATGIQSEDGFNWRKYGQKHVKGSEYPRSYYKCTHPNCQVKKKVERSLEGVTTEITYQGNHNHPKPLSQSRRLSMGPGLLPLVEAMPADSSVIDGHGPGADGFLTEAMGASDIPSNEDDDEQGAEEDELESKKRKLDLASMETGGASRAVREPRVVVQTTSEVDILDDGYRWRKYGQKVVKGNPNPRSYYKCTNAGCTVRKHVERASHDLKSVITTYEGKHNHDVPAARSGNQSASGPPGGGGRRSLAGFDGPPLPPSQLPPLGSFAPGGYPLVGQATMWALQHGNGWPGSYQGHEDPSVGQFGGVAASLEGAWFRDTQG